VSNGAMIISNSDHSQSNYSSVIISAGGNQLGPGTYALTFDSRILDTLDRSLILTSKAAPSGLTVLVPPEPSPVTSVPSIIPSRFRRRAPGRTRLVSSVGGRLRSAIFASKGAESDHGDGTSKTASFW
jgi:hypothetical protein